MHKINILNERYFKTASFSVLIVCYLFNLESLVLWAMPVPNCGGQSYPALPEETP
jgi:hypothetical protein